MQNNRLSGRFPRSFYVANTMEIFERLAWYGFFTVSSLYMTTPSDQGGLGFSDQERGFLQGIVPFILYILPVFTGALADRYGYQKMFIVSLLIMGPSYFLLGQMTGFWSFGAVFTIVAIGAALFKPIAVGTVGRTTDDNNRGLGFGIFYMMVNIGGFIGPIIAGYVRAISWDLVFAMSSFWILINLLPAIFLYREPSKTTRDERSIGEVLLGAREVLGNARLLVFVLPLIGALVALAKNGDMLVYTLVFVACWIVANAVWSFMVSRRGSTKWYMQGIKLGDTSFVAYLLILSVFWAVYYQVFLTLPLYIRDFVNTRDLVHSLNSVFPGVVDQVAKVNIDHLSSYLTKLQLSAKISDANALHSIKLSLASMNVLVPDAQLHVHLTALQDRLIDAQSLAVQLAKDHRQIQPEYIINVEFAVIIAFQVLVSSLAQKFRSLPVLVWGTVTLAVSMAIIGGAGATSGSGLVVLFAVVVFAIAEMIASPKSQEYVAAIAPQSKTAMFMGYYFISMALGNLFAGLLSGWAYSSIAKGLNNPALMWQFFAALAVLSAVALLGLDRSMRRRV